MDNIHYNNNSGFQQVSRFSLLDFSVILTSLGLILSGIYLYQFKGNTLLNLRNLVPIAKIETQEYESSRKIPGTINWQKTNLGDQLFDGDTILTNETSSVLVKFDNGNELNIAPQTMVKITSEKGQYEVDLIKGSVKVKSQDSSKTKLKYKDTGEEIVVNDQASFTSTSSGLITDQAGSNQDGIQNIIRSPSLNMKIDPSQSKTFDVELVKSHTGTIELRDTQGGVLQRTPLSQQSSTNLNTPVPGRYVVLIKNQQGETLGMTSVVVSNYSAPEILVPQVKSQYYRGEKIEYRWNGRDDLQYLVEWNQNNRLKKMIVKGNRIQLQLEKSGEYKIKVSVFKQKTKNFSAHEFNANVIDGLIIPEDQRFQETTFNVPVQFDVENPNKDSKIAFEMSSTDDFQSAQELGKSIDGKKQIVLKKSGVYYVRAKDTNKPDLVSAPAKVVVAGPVASILPNQRKQTIFTPKVSNEQIKLGYIADKNAKSIKIQVSKDPTFKDVVLEKESSENAEMIQLNDLGKYYWRVMPAQNSPEYLKPTEPMEIDIRLPMPITKPEVIAKQIIYYKNINGLPSYEIQLVEKPFVKNYHIEVFADQGLEQLVFKKSFNKAKAYWISNRSGKFYYRVKTEDVWGRMSGYSETGVLVFPISPLVQ